MREAILEIGRDLAVGQSVMAECPECSVKKLSVTRYEDGLGYHCWRASCTLKPGAVTIGARGLGVGTPRPMPAEFKRVGYPYSTSLPREGDFAHEIVTRIGTGNPTRYTVTYGAECGILASGANVAVFRLYSLDNRERGWQSRDRNKQVRSGKLRPGPLYGTALPGKSEYPAFESCWIVEDPISAEILAARNRFALTILGTRLDVAVLDELWDAYPDCRRIYVALDPGAEDAAREAVRLCRSERGLDAIQVPLPDDIHRLDQDTLSRLLEAYP